MKARFAQVEGSLPLSLFLEHVSSSAKSRCQADGKAGSEFGRLRANLLAALRQGQASRSVSLAVGRVVLMALIAANVAAYRWL